VGAWRDARVAIVEDRVMAQPGAEQSARAIGPAVGSRFPDLELSDQTGRTIDLQQDRAGRRALIVVYRSARW
jgi:hypothetical protein